MNGVGNPRLDVLAPSLPLGVNPAADLTIPVARIADMLLHPGGEYSFQGQQRRYPAIDMIYWACGNPFHHHQQLNRLLAGWRKPATVVVQDIWSTPAAKLADIVLPVTTSLERNDIGGSSRDRYVLAMQQAVALLQRRAMTSPFSLNSRSVSVIGKPLPAGATNVAGSRRYISKARYPMPPLADFRRFLAARLSGIWRCPLPRKTMCLWRNFARIRSGIRCIPRAAVSNFSAKPLPVLPTKILGRCRNGVRRRNGWGMIVQRAIRCILSPSSPTIGCTVN